MNHRQTLSAAAAADIAEQVLREAIAEHGLTDTLEDVLDSALATAYEWGVQAGYEHALTVHHIPSDD